MTIYAHWGWKNNADMIARGVRPLGYLDGTVLDATHGLGNFWTDWRPEHLTAVDLHPDKGAVTADFRHLPFPDGGFDSVAFDPGYKLNGKPSAGGPADSDANYGVDEPRTWQDRYQLIFDGMTECARVSRRYVLVKCMDQVSSGHVRWQTVDLTIHGARVGLDRVDHFDLPGYREQPKDRTRRCSDCDGTGARFLDGTGTCLDCDGAGFVPVAQQHAARNWSTLLVFRKLRPGRHTYHHAFPELRLLPDGDD